MSLRCFLDSLSEEDRALLLEEIETACIELRPVVEEYNDATIAEMEETYGAIINFILLVLFPYLEYANHFKNATAFQSP